MDGKKRTGQARIFRRLTMRLFLTALCLLPIAFADAAESGDRPRARDIGLVVGIFPTGPLNAITDVAGVKVGHSTGH